MLHRRHSDSVFRSCSRCGKELTDAASRECGIGPICRKKNNAIFARHMPANLTIASIHMLSLSQNDFHPEIAEQFPEIKEYFLKQLFKAQKNNDDYTRAKVKGGDFREVVDYFDVALSYPCSYDFRIKLIEIIENLGYQALGGILRGDVCMSPAKLYIQDAYIYLQGKSNKPGFLEMRKTIPGIQTPRYRGDSTPYKASVKHAEKFVDIILRFWPFVEGDPNMVLHEAKKRCDELPKDIVEKSDLPVAQLTVGGLGYQIKTPWHGTRKEMMETLEKIKNLPKKERKYNPALKCWSFTKNNLDKVKNIVGERYNIVTHI